MSIALRVLAGVLLIDGLTTALFGSTYVSEMQRRVPGKLKRAADWFMEWPEPTLRLYGLVQAGISAFLLARSFRSRR